MTRIFFFELVLFYTITAWTEPSSFIITTTANGYDLLSLYSDPNSKMIHILYTDKDNEGLFYFRLKNRNKDASKRLVDIKEYRGTPVITGSGDGKHIFVAYANNRNHAVFLESETNGDTWGIPLEFKSTECNAIGSLVNIAEIGRLYITFSGNRNVTFATRPPNSKVFSPETVIFQNTKDIWPSASCYTLKQKNPIIHVAVPIGNYYIAYIQSENNGISWSKPRNIRIYDQNGKIVMLSYPKITNTFFLFFHVGEDTDGGFIYSRDNGYNFSKIVEVEREWIARSAVICGNETNKVMSIIGASNYWQFINWESGKVEGEADPSRPFDPNYSQLTCIEGDPTSLMMVGPVKSYPYVYGTSIKKWTD